MWFLLLEMCNFLIENVVVKKLVKKVDLVNKEIANKKWKWLRENSAPK